MNFFDFASQGFRQFSKLVPSQFRNKTTRNDDESNNDNNNNNYNNDDDEKTYS